MIYLFFRLFSITCYFIVKFVYYFLEFSIKIDNEFSGDFLTGTTTASINAEHSGSGDFLVSGSGDDLTTPVEDEFSGMFATILFERSTTTILTTTPTPMKEMITG